MSSTYFTSKCCSFSAICFCFLCKHAVNAHPTAWLRRSPWKGNMTQLPTHTCTKMVPVLCFISNEDTEYIMFAGSNYASYPLYRSDKYMTITTVNKTIPNMPNLSHLTVFFIYIKSFPMSSPQILSQRIKLSTYNIFEHHVITLLWHIITPFYKTFCVRVEDTHWWVSKQAN